ALFHLLDVLRQRRDRGAACVGADRGALMAVLREEVHGFQQQIGRQVVDAVVARILEHPQGDGLARAGQPADEHQLHYSPSSICCFWRARNSAVVSMPRSLRMALRTAASTSTARLRPAATGMVTFGTVTPRISSDSSASGRRS